MRSQRRKLDEKIEDASLSTLPRCLLHAVIRSKVSLPPSLSRANSEH